MNPVASRHFVGYDAIVLKAVTEKIVARCLGRHLP